jgi:hypothetical protein
MVQLAQLGPEGRRVVLVLTDKGLRLAIRLALQLDAAQ